MNPSTFTPLPSNISRKTWGCWRYLRIQQLFLVINYLRVFIVTFSWQQFADISLNAIGDTRISHLCNFFNWTIFFLKKKNCNNANGNFYKPTKKFRCEWFEHQTLFSCKNFPSDVSREWFFIILLCGKCCVLGIFCNKTILPI